MSGQWKVQDQEQNAPWQVWGVWGCVFPSLTVGPASSLLPQPLRARPPTPTLGALACPPSSWVWALWPILQGKPGMGMWWRLSEVHTSKVETFLEGPGSRLTPCTEEPKLLPVASPRAQARLARLQEPQTTMEEPFFFKLCFI